MPAAAIGDTPLYQGVADALRSQIRSGQLAPGARVPTEHELMDSYDVSRSTVRLALNLLSAEGLITAGRGRAGRVVRRRDLITLHVAPESAQGQPGLAEIDGFVAEMRDQGFAPSQHIEIAMERAPELVAARLGLPADATVVVRKRLRYVDGAPCSIADSYFPYEMVKDTPVMSPADIQPGVVSWFAERGRPQSRYVDEVSTKMPEPDEAHRLQLGQGVPVLIQNRTHYLQDAPAWVTRIVLRGDRHRIVYDLPGAR
ncbi:MAG: GntR family transcriptional regulator [Micromonosporaceae bacterium]